MNQYFYDRVANSTAHRPIRDELSGEVLNNHDLLPDLLTIAFNVKDKNHHKACWIMELVFEAKIDWLTPHLEDFCNTLQSFKHESALRPVSKICQFAAEKNDKAAGFIKGKQLQQIIEACFDWLINPEGKVATKAYAMRALFLIGKKEDWIYPELQVILSQDFPNHTAAYKAAAKDILKKINKRK